MANINVVAPDGTVGTIPEENYDQAVSAGFKMATPGETQLGSSEIPLKSPDGEIGTVPKDNYDAAIGAGFKELTPEEEETWVARKHLKENPTQGAIGAGIARFTQNVPNAVVGAVDMVRGGAAPYVLTELAENILPGSGIGTIQATKEYKEGKAEAEKKAGELFREDTAKPDPLFDPFYGTYAREAIKENPKAALMGEGIFDGVTAAGLTTTLGSPVGIAIGSQLDAVEQEAHDVWLNDRPMSAENIALYGSINLAGGVAGATLGSLAPAVKNSIDDVAARTASNVLEHVDAQAAARAANVAESKITAEVTSLAEAQKNISSGAKSYIVKNADELSSQSVDDVTKALQDIRHDIDSHGARSLSEDELLKRIPERKTGYVSQQGSAINMKDYLRNTAEEVAAAEPKLAKKLAKYADDMDKASKPNVWFSSAARATDDLEQAIGKLSKNGDTTALPRLQNAQANLRRELSSEDIWGTASVAETRRFNSYNTTYGPSTSNLDDSFYNASGALIPDKIEKAIKSGSTKAIDQYLAEGRKVAEYIGGFDEKAGASLKKKIDQAAIGLNKVKFYTDVEKSYGPKANAYKEVGKEILDFAKDLPGVRQVVQGARVIKSATKAIGHASNLTDNKTVKSVYETLNSVNESNRKFWKDTVRKGLEAVQERPAKSRWAERPAEGAVGGLVAANVFADWTKDPYSYKTDTQKIVALSKDPEALANKIADSFGSIATSHPQVFSDIMGQQYKAVMYLASKAPAVPRRGLAVSKNYTPSEDQVWEYSLYYSAVMDPESVAVAVANGTAKPQQLEALQVVYPKKYAELRENVLEELNRMDELGLPVSINGRATIDLLLNADGAGDPAFSWDVALNVSSSRQTKAQQDQNANINPTSVSQSPSAQSAKPQGLN